MGSGSAFTLRLISPAWKRQQPSIFNGAVLASSKENPAKKGIRTPGGGLRLRDGQRRSVLQDLHLVEGTDRAPPIDDPFLAEDVRPAVTINKGNPAAPRPAMAHQLMGRSQAVSEACLQ